MRLWGRDKSARLLTAQAASLERSEAARLPPGKIAPGGSFMPDEAQNSRSAHVVMNSAP